MNTELLSYLKENAQELLAAPSCSREAMAATQSWLNALGTEREKEENLAFIKELEADIIPIDGLIAFTQSAEGIKIFGEEKARLLCSHGKEIKAAGAKYCDCPACTAALAILEKKNDILG